VPKRPRRQEAIDRWKDKNWFSVYSPKYFGNVQIAQIPSTDDVLNRIIETTLYDITNDFSQTYIKLYLKVDQIDGTNAYTKFYGHDFTRDYLRSLVRRTTSQVKGIFNINIKADATPAAPTYKLRVTAVVFTQRRAKTSQQKAIREIMKQVIEEKAQKLSFIEFVQESVLGKIGSEIHNQARIIVPIRKSEIMKTKIVSEPTTSAA
jgi:small subunit ribosomal protein S3Ae